LEDSVLYHQIADAIRGDILAGRYQPGDRLPSVRKLCAVWNCTPGTVQRAYNELAREGLLVSRAGRGTQVAGTVPRAKAQAYGTLRRANLVNRMETALLEALTAGYDLDEVRQAMDLAMDRWRVLKTEKEDRPAQTLRFAGSHDMVMNGIAQVFFGRLVPEVTLRLNYNGSLGGLIALAEGTADLAGCHLWDAESDRYNLPYVRRLLPGQEATVVTLAHRRIGLITAPGNPQQVRGMADLTRPGIRFVNRQPGSGTRVWLDATLSRLGIDPRQIAGYADERLTHSDVARAVAEGVAHAGLGLETAAAAYGLDFAFLNRERYDLVLLAETAQQPAVRQLFAWLGSADGKQFVSRYPGYESQETGAVQVFG
jgi:molybdate-binding protein/DNA-binding transcriptional regulator YhcF (GntR family)